MGKSGGTDGDRPLIKSNKAAAVVLLANTVFVLYLIFQAWVESEEWRRIVSIVGAAGLALLTGAVAWARFGQRR